MSTKNRLSLCPPGRRAYRLIHLAATRPRIILLKHLLVSVWNSYLIIIVLCTDEYYTAVLMWYSLAIKYIYVYNNVWCVCVCVCTGCPESFFFLARKEKAASSPQPFAFASFAYHLSFALNWFLSFLFLFFSFLLNLITMCVISPSSFSSSCHFFTSRGKFFRFLHYYHDKKQPWWKMFSIMEIARLREREKEKA